MAGNLTEKKNAGAGGVVQLVKLPHRVPDSYMSASSNLTCSTNNPPPCWSLRLLRSGGISERNYWLLASNWPCSGRGGHLGSKPVDEQLEDPFLSFHLCNSGFQTNKYLFLKG